MILQKTVAEYLLKYYPAYDILETITTSWEETNPNVTFYKIRVSPSPTYGVILLTYDGDYHDCVSEARESVFDELKHGLSKKYKNTKFGTP